LPLLRSRRAAAVFFRRRGRASAGEIFQRGDQNNTMAKRASPGRAPHTLCRVDGFDYGVSHLQTKKLFAVVGGKKVHFGAAGSQHFRDRTGLLPASQSHGDAKRRASYRARHAGDNLGDPNSPGYHAWRILW
jgi:hypothetical protein